MTDKSIILETRIKDEGQGMTKEKQRTLFKMFDSAKKQAHTSNCARIEGQSDCTSGCGLGLFLSLHLTQYLGGDIII